MDAIITGKRLPSHPILYIHRKGSRALAGSTRFRGLGAGYKALALRHDGDGRHMTFLLLHSQIAVNAQTRFAISCFGSEEIGGLL